MAWTWSTPQRGTLAATLARVGGQLKNGSAAVQIGKVDTARGQLIAIAAWLGVAGAAAPNVPPVVMMALLCATGAALLLFAAFPATGTYDDIDEKSASHEHSNARAQRSAPARIEELLVASADRTSITDRAAFAKLTSHMSHELRTPLNAILGFSELMSNEVFGPLGSSSYAGYARDIHRSGLSLLKSAEDSLAITALLTAPEHIRRAATANAASAAGEALRFHAQALAAQGVHASCTIDGETGILCDAQTARQLLINLIDDAAARAASGATLTIASRDVGQEFEILITVSDTTGTLPATDSFSMLLARTLAELSGASLETTSCNGDCLTTARFNRAVQHELF